MDRANHPLTASLPASLQPAEPRDAGSIITILFEEHSLCSKRDGLRRLTEFQPLPSPPVLPAARHSNLLSSPHAGKSVVNVILCGKCHSDKTERRTAIVASCRAMGIEDADASVIHEFDSCKRAGSLTGLSWRFARRRG